MMMLNASIRPEGLMRGSTKSLHQTSRAKMPRAAAWTLNRALQSGISHPLSMPIHPQRRLRVANSVSTFPLFFPFLPPLSALRHSL